MVTQIEFDDTELKVATGVARRVNRAQRNIVDTQDVQSECYVWMCKNYKRVLEWRDEGKKGKAKLNTALYRAGMRFVVRERARITRTDVSDHAFYSESVLHELLPDIFDEESWSLESHAEDNERKAPPRLSEGNTRLAMIVDVKFAYEKLNDEQKVLLRNRFADGGMTVSILAATMSTHETTVRRKIRSALRALSDRLGGEPPWM